MTFSPRLGHAALGVVYCWNKDYTVQRTTCRHCYLLKSETINTTAKNYKHYKQYGIIRQTVTQYITAMTTDDIVEQACHMYSR